MRARIPVHVHLVPEYARLFRRLGMSLHDLREPCIGADLVARFLSLSPFEGVPLAIVMEARK